ncbi:winged helix-turn-helix domain-containing protein [Serratia fonticola]|uniref:winged helix-turn-helix domain-containing protein n=1 Tax=Serratia fonticola TaxID=47917 RepID=UPI00192A7E72|nr:winged helix-turn-helix domain-containing protein [Serratia fonticola]MBL5906871.1 winged helix-turn-helix domain-containing protein [Serratia fonticola]
MDKTYLINDMVLFYPEQSKLVLRDGSVPAVTLNIPASRCFSLLIERKNSVVSQHEFFELIWEERGSYVTPNTFYQNISLLRKGLKAVGISDDVIITVPKKGLTLSAEISVIPYDNATDIPVTENNALADDPQHSLLRSTDIPITTSGKKRINLPFIFVVTGIFIGMLGWTLYSWPGEVNYFKDYLYLDKNNECTFFSPSVDTNKEKYLTFIRDQNVSCLSGHYAYITIYRGTPKVSVIICDKDIASRGVFCETQYYLKAEDGY